VAFSGKIRWPDGGNGGNACYKVIDAEMESFKKLGENSRTQRGSQGGERSQEKAEFGGGGSSHHLKI